MRETGFKESVGNGRLLSYLPVLVLRPESSQSSSLSRNFKSVIFTLNLLGLEAIVYVCAVHNFAV